MSGLTQDDSIECAEFAADYEMRRVEALKRLQIMDTAPEPFFDQITALAAASFTVPIVLVTLLDGQRQWFKSCFGSEHMGVSQTKQELALCFHTLQNDEPLVVSDTTKDPRFQQNPLVVGPPHVRFYAGAPLKSDDGLNLGGLCLLDFTPREFGQGQTELLSQMANMVSTEIVRRHLNLSQQQNAQLELSKSENFKAAVVETALDCIVAMDHQGKVVEWNPAAESTFGFSREQAIGRAMHELIVPPELRSAHLQGLQNYLKSGDGPVLGQRLELPAVRSDGARIEVELAILPVPHAQSPLFIGHLRDISEKLANEARLLQATQRISAVLESINDAFFLLDSQWCFAYVNDEAESVLGRTRAQLLGRNIWDEFPDVQETEFGQSYLRAVESGQQVVFEAYYEPFKQWFNVSAYPSSEGLAVHVQNITARHEAQRSIELAKEEAEVQRSKAEQANQAKSAFLSRMSHELRTPLNAILGFGQLLEMSDLAPDDAEGAHLIVKAGRHLLNLINEVLDISRIENDTMSLSLEAVSLKDSLIETLDLVGPMAQKKNIQLDPSSLLGCDRHVIADKQRLKQVMLNLLSNAIKYNHSGGRVVLDWSESGNRVRVWVRDNGPGIEASKMPRLFVPFDRLDAETQDNEGVGIGLALSKRLAELMNGRLGAESEFGVGSSFWLELARSEAPAQNQHDEEILDAQEITFKHRVVLYIEDNLSNLQLLERILKRHADIKLLSAMQGSTGLELAFQHLPHLILLDLHLPGMDGEEVLRRLRENPATRHIPVIILSADATPGQVKRLKQMGASAYLTKPFDINEFLKILAAHLPDDSTVENSADTRVFT